MRRRKRDWPITVYRYRLLPESIAAEIWDTAERQRLLWNHLVELFESLKLLDTMYGVVGFWAAFDRGERQARERSGLDWVNGPDVADRFRASLKRSGRVKFQRRGAELSICHRFTGGGITTKQLLKHRGTRLRLEIPSDWSYEGNRRPHGAHRPMADHPLLTFGMGQSRSSFRVIVHRQLPDDGMVKRATLSGRQIGSYWQWHINFTLEVPPKLGVKSTCDRVSRPIAGLDLGWRVFEGYLRIGMLADSEGRLFELRLPWHINQKRQPPNRKGVTYAVTESELRSLRDQRRNEGKADEVERLSAALLQIGLHWRQRRAWFYSNLAHWLCDRYARIVWEGELRLQEMARRDRNSSLPLKLAAKYRSMVAVGEFRSILQRVAIQQGTTIVDAKTVNSTITCNKCGELAVPGSSLFLECARGHHWDQDENAAANLFSEIGGDFAQFELLRNSWISNGAKRLDIPARIVAVTVEVPPR